MVRPIIDSHVHLWDLLRTPRETSPLAKVLGWHPGALRWAARKVFPRAAARFYGRPDNVVSDHLPEHYREQLGDREVEGFVHVEAGWKGTGPLGPVGETRWLESLHETHLRAIVGQVDLTLGDGVDVVLRAHLAASAKFRGVRQLLSYHSHAGVLNGAERVDLMNDGKWRRGYERLAAHGLSFDATVYHPQLGDLASLAEDVPDVPVVVCHAGTPVSYGGAFVGLGATATERDQVAQTWRSGMSRLAELPNVTVKISGLAMPVLGWGYHEGAPPTAERVAEDIAPLVDFLIDTFGADRCMFASNFPVDRVSMPWATLFDAFERVVSGRPEAELRALFHDTAARVYRL